MAKDNPRARRLGAEIQRELTELLRRDVKDERIGNVTITAVDVTGDLRTRQACYYLIFGKDGPDPAVQRGLTSAAGFLRNALSKSLMIRYTPTLTFELDTSIEHGVRLTQLIDSVNKRGDEPGNRVMAADVHGILLLDKPLGLSSAGAVARLKYLFNARKAGHTGSLDPLASGMLPICFGEATKFGALMLDADKTYRVTVRLGERTPSADLESAVIERRDAAAAVRRALERALAEFPRDYAQVPPMHSALKQDGKPLYEYARAGEIRERARAPDRDSRHAVDRVAVARTCPSMCAARKGPISGCWRRIWRRGSTPSAIWPACAGSAVAPFADAPQWTLEALEPHVAGRSARRCCCRSMRRSPSGRGSIWRPRGSQAVRQGQSIAVPREAPGKVRIYAPGLGFLGLGAVQAAGRLVPLRLISAVTNRA